jgi:hypothetical protein
MIFQKYMIYWKNMVIQYSTVVKYAIQIDRKNRERYPDQT